MSELEDRINALLQSPEDMERIASMASRLMGQIAPETPAESDGSGEMLKMAGKILQGMNTGGQKALLAGMAPYLAEERRRRLERALRIASAARAATAALREMGGVDGI